MEKTPPRPALWLVLPVVLLILAVYRRTLMPGVGLSDTAEFQAVPHLLGIAHPTGYPTYTLLGKLFSFWPEGTIAWRMNWFAAISGATAAGLLALLARRLGAGRWLAAGAGLALAFHQPFWENALSAEPHMLHVAIALGVVALALRWHETQRTRWLFATALAFGLGLGNHMQLVMFFPALLALLLVRDPGVLARPRGLAAALGGGLAGLSVFLYLPLRAMQRPALNYAHPDTWERFRYLVLGEQFRGEMGFLTLRGLETFLVKAHRLPLEVAGWFTAPGALMLAAFGLAGAVVLARRDWRQALFLALAFLVPLYTACNYVNDDLRRYFFTSTALAVLSAAVGAQAVIAAFAAGIARVGAQRTAAIVAAALAVAVGLAPLAQVPAHWARTDRSGVVQGRAVIEGVFARVEKGAVVVAWWDLSTALWYGRYVDPVRQDVTVIDDRNAIDDGYGSVFGAIEAFVGRRPVYVVRHPGDIRYLQTRYELVPVTVLEPYAQPLYRVLGRR